MEIGQNSVFNNYFINEKAEVFDEMVNDLYYNKKSFSRWKILKII